MPRAVKFPTYRLHKSRGLAVVTIVGKNHSPIERPELPATALALSRLSLGLNRF